MTLLSVQNLALDLPLSGGLLSALNPKSRRSLQIFADVSFTLNPGETLGLVGESGSGKTTLARAFLGLTPTTHGSIHFDQAPRKTKADFTARRAHTAMMFQDAIASLSPRMTIGALLAEPLTIHRQPAPAAKIADMLALVGLPASSPAATRMNSPVAKPAASASPARWF